MFSLNRVPLGDSNTTSSLSIRIETIRNRLKTNKSLKFNSVRGNSFEVIIASKNEIDLVMCILVNHHSISSCLRIERPNRKSDSEQDLFNYRRYQDISEIEQEVIRLQNVVDKVNE